MYYLNLSIRCRLPQHPQKNCLLKIHNRQLDLHIQLENKFVHNYEYIYRLWPCEPGDPHVVRLELWERDNAQEMRLRGTAEAKIACTQEGDLYKFHGNRSEGQVFLMRYWAEKAESEGGSSREEAELRKINSEMEQNLLKYREEIQNYQQFLYFTNNVIKELNSDSIEARGNQPDAREVQQPDPPEQINIDGGSMEQEQKGQEQKEIALIPTKRKAEQAEIAEEETYRSKAFNKSTDSQQDLPNKSQIRSQGGSIKGGSRASRAKAENYLSKYRYLEEVEASKVEISKINSDSVSQTSRKTPINIFKEGLDEESPEIRNKKQRQAEISNKIRQRRQQYFIASQIKQVDESRVESRNLQTPINRLSSELLSKISKHSLHRHHYLSEEAGQQKQKESKQQGRVNLQPPGKLSTRSQTGLKDVPSHYEKKPSIHDYVIEARQQMQINSQYSHSKQPSEYKQSEVKSYHNPTQIANTAAPITPTDNPQTLIPEETVIPEEPVVPEEPVSHSQSTIHNMARRRKVIAQNSASILGEIEDMNHSIHSVSRHEDLSGSAVSKLVIFGLRSTFYANFKSSTKKCIVEHNSQVYQTELQRNNLKQTAWSDRIVVAGLRPGEDLVLMVYAMRMDQVELEGTAIANINTVLSSPQRHFKFYLYFDNIAVGSIEFEVEREKRAYKRLAVSLPQIKAKSPPRQEVGCKTIRIKTHNDQFDRIEAHPQGRDPSNTAEFKQSSHASDREHSSLMPTNNEMSKKVRNVKLTKLSRLVKIK